MGLPLPVNFVSQALQMEYGRWTFMILGLALLFTGCLAGRAAGEEKSANLLGSEASPYLLKHAANPVNWRPWGKEAFSQARAEDKPVFLSIGYLTCHWCNVMEEESFSDPEVAALINDVFIPVKVDREERPDIDQIYMQACQLLSPACGWPLTLFLTQEGRPFYAGTYIPKESRFGRIGLLALIPRVKELWAHEREPLLKSAESINAAIISSTIRVPGRDMDAAQLDAAFKVYQEAFDSEYGGFGTSTKFPKPLNLLFLLRYWHRTGSAESLAMVEKTLHAMRRGGIYDHLGYGFHRYATDRMWRLPHFEKMLYDQALLVLIYLETYQATGRTEYADTAKEILYYVLHNMTAKEGSFYSAESADSEGEEGKFYLWTAADIGQILTRHEADLAGSIYHIMADGNYTDPVTGRKTGLNILYADRDVRSMPDMETIRRKMLAARNTRPRPELDDKVLADWNGLMIAAFARAAQVFDLPEYGAAAKNGARFILHTMRTPDGKLLHRWRKGRPGLTATAADYSFLIWGLLELYGWDFNAEWLQQALDLNTVLLESYWDKEMGGFFLTPPDETSILPRLKESHDTAVPSSNGVAMYNLLQLSRLTGNHTFAEKAAKINALLSSDAGNYPLAFPMFLGAMHLVLAPSQEIAIVGRRDAPDTAKMIRALRQGYFPAAVVLFKQADELHPPVTRYAEFLEYMVAKDNKATAYVCTDFRCTAPTTDPAEMIDKINAIKAQPRTD